MFQMIVDDMVKRTDSWLTSGIDEGIVISSRVRVARNIKNYSFPGWAKEDEREALSEKLWNACSSVDLLVNPVYLDMGKLEAVDKDVLRERRLISNELAEKGAGSGLVIAEDQLTAIMVNEEDHLRLQAISPGMNLRAVWEKIDAVDTELEKYLDYAFSTQLGYLCACPTNTGTGLRISAMMHLSGLKLLNEIDPVIKGLDKMNIVVRGLLGEGTEEYGNMFQVSNQSTLGESEEAIVDRLTSVVTELMGHEQNARARLLEDKKIFLMDQIGRSFGILSQAYVLSSMEAVDMLSGIRLGVEMGLIENLTVCDINEILLLMQPGHLQKLAGKVLSPEERDQARAEMVKKKLKGVLVS
jgi:protein arginine kinase